MSNEHALIYPHIADNSAATKAVTYRGELIDFVQFAFMTTFSEGIDSVSRYGFHKRDFVPEKSIIGLDIFAYAMMVYLAYIRSEKFKERYKAFIDHNTPEYYEKTANALIAAMTEAEKIALGLGGLPNQTQRVIDLIKHDAHALSPQNIPAARTLIDTAQIIFARAKKKKEFAAARYDFKEWAKALKGVSIGKGNFALKDIFTEKEFMSESFEGIELAFIKKILNATRLNQDAPGTPESFIAELHHIELSGNLKAKEDHIALLETYNIREQYREDCYQLIKAFYSHYNLYQDRNDSAFYIGNMRGINGDEKCRTKFKENLYTTVLGASIVATVYSMANFVSAFFLPVSLLHLYLPLFLVGTTSLVDEVSDLHFKTRKYNQSKQDLERWIKANKVLADSFKSKATQKIDLSGYTQEIDEFAARFDKRPVDLNELFIDAKRKEYQGLVDRIERREKKLIQASLSFTGVFFGVSLSMAVAVLSLTTHTAQVVSMLGFAGMATIAVAFVAGAYMVNYQYQQHQNKGVTTGAKQTDLVLKLEEKHSSSSSHPLRFSEYRFHEASLKQQSTLSSSCTLS